MAGMQVELQTFYQRNATLGTTERYREATDAELRYWSLQYEHLETWDEGLAKGVPLRGRKPRVVLPLFKEAIDGLERFVWGGHRFPAITVSATRQLDEPERADEIGPRLDHEQAGTLTRFTRELIRAGRLDRAIREASRAALITTSCAVIIGTRGGYLSTHVEAGKHCTPTFDPVRPGAVVELEVLYQYEREEESPTGGIRKRLYWYRRTVTTERDIVYKEVPVQVGVKPVWTEDPEKSVDHRLGFCPVRWVRVLPDSTDPIDGRPVIDPALYPLLDEANYTVSLRNRSVQYNTDPLVARYGVPVGERDVVVRGGTRTIDLPGKPEGGLDLVESTGKATEQATAHLVDLETRFRDAVQVVKANPEIATGKISGVVLEFLHAPMIALASDLRADLGDDGFVGLINLALRLCAVVTERGEDVWVQGVGEAMDILRAAQLRGVWLDLPIDIKWPAFFAPTVEDQKATVDTANAAKSGGLISAKTASAHVAEIFNVEDIEAEHELVEQEAAAQADYGRMLGDAPKPEPGDPAKE